ncbi:unnamed protein product [Moneuplotes crassus]|uniref:Uncharacterized protein n=1 Tax=Euplotes crassus TaxID=5936 RepID=A0AAD2D330_EUPCR|nr:unnamed protein product [Moneuplotes crassus]
MENTLEIEEQVQAHLNEIYKSFSKRYAEKFVPANCKVLYKTISDEKVKHLQTDFSRANSVTMEPPGGKKDAEKINKLGSSLREIRALMINSKSNIFVERLKINWAYSLLSKTTGMIKIVHFKILAKCLQRLLFASRRVEEVCLHYCDIFTGGFDLIKNSQAINFEIKRIEIFLCDEHERPKKYFCEFEILYDLISKSSLKESLKEIEVNHCEFFESTSDKMTQKYNLQNIKVRISSISPNFGFQEASKPSKISKTKKKGKYQKAKKSRCIVQ